MAARRIDWAALKAEWLQSDETLHAFQVRKRLGERNFYRVAKRDGWTAAREEIGKMAGRRIEQKLARETADKWFAHRELFRGAHSHAAAILKKSLGSNGEVLKPLSPAELLQLVTAIQKMGQAEAFMSGEATDHLKVSGQMAHAHLVAGLMGAFHKGDPGVIDPAAIGAEDEIRPDVLTGG